MLRRFLFAATLTWRAVAVEAAAQDRAVPGQVVFQADFESPTALEGWTGSPGLGPGRNGGHALFIERSPAAGPGSTVAQLKLPVEQVRGCLVNLTGWVRAEGVTEKPESWNGIKYMAPVVAPGKRSYPQAGIGVGSFGWRRVAFAVRIPENATDWRLYMGLEAVTGSVWFDDLRIVVRKGPFVRKPPAASGAVYTGHPAGMRLRGAMVSPNIGKDSLRVLGVEWKANLVRWQLVGYRPPKGGFSPKHYNAWLEQRLQQLDAALPVCREYGMYVVIDVHSPPRGGPDSGANLFTDRECQRGFVDNWKRMARRYKDSEVVWAYDLVNEPNERFVPEDCLDWQALAETTAKAVREIDPDHAIIVETPVGGGPGGFKYMNPIDAPGVVYSLHMYEPHAFTHQGVRPQWNAAQTYPGVIGGKKWDKAQIEKTLAPAVEFSRRYNVQIFVGEFSAVRWAPNHSAFRYLRDCIDVFEEHGWDWTYHAFREWPGWSVERGPVKEDTTRPPNPTDREKLLRRWFAKNRNPPFAPAPDAVRGE
ncbi:MAG: glycoside hydrolase family 5 protein [Kiritimatiellaeota bacterium]|nr:glycoside hydrolase family 5 protein [Kiritimatiellota bacterium]